MWFYSIIYYILIIFSLKVTTIIQYFRLWWLEDGCFLEHYNEADVLLCLPLNPWATSVEMEAHAWFLLKGTVKTSVQCVAIVLFPMFSVSSVSSETSIVPALSFQFARDGNGTSAGISVWASAAPSLSPGHGCEDPYSAPALAGPLWTSGLDGNKKQRVFFHLCEGFRDNMSCS